MSSIINHTGGCVGEVAPGEGRGEAASDYKRPEDKVIGRCCRLFEPRLRPCLYSKPKNRRANTYHYVNNKLGRLRFSSTFTYSLSLSFFPSRAPSSQPSSPSLPMNLGLAGCCLFSCSGRDVDAAQSPLPSCNSSLKSTSSASRAHSCHPASAGWSTAERNSFNAMVLPLRPTLP